MRLIFKKNNAMETRRHWDSTLPQVQSFTYHFEAPILRTELRNH